MALGYQKAIKNRWKIIQTSIKIWNPSWNVSWYRFLMFLVGFRKQVDIENRVKIEQKIDSKFDRKKECIKMIFFSFTVQWIIDHSAINSSLFCATSICLYLLWWRFSKYLGETPFQTNWAFLFSQAIDIACLRCCISPIWLHRNSMGFDSRLLPDHSVVWVELMRRHGTVSRRPLPNEFQSFRESDFITFSFVTFEPNEIQFFQSKGAGVGALFHSKIPLQAWLDMFKEC